MIQPKIKWIGQQITPTSNPNIIPAYAVTKKPNASHGKRRMKQHLERNGFLFSYPSHGPHSYSLLTWITFLTQQNISVTPKNRPVNKSMYTLIIGHRMSIATTMSFLVDSSLAFFTRETKKQIFYSPIGKWPHLNSDPQTVHVSAPHDSQCSVSIPTNGIS